MNDTTVDRLERLAKLRAEGALNDAEYDVEKAKLLNERERAADRTATLPRPETPIDEASLAPIWRERFRMIDQYGMPNGRAYSDATRDMEPWERVRVVLSPLAYLLGPLYFLYLGLWRPAISLTGIVIAFSLMIDALQVPAWLDRATFFITPLIYAWACIPLYYLRVRRGVHSWNPFVWLGA